MRTVENSAGKNYSKAFFSLLILIGVLLASFQPILIKANVSSTDFVNAQTYNNLISNQDFIDKSSMSVADIQQFLLANNSALKDFSENGRSAAQIIHDAASGKKFTQPPWDTWLGDTFKNVLVNESSGTVSPKVLLTMLQKEQSLITKTSLDSDAMTIAMGYGCPDGSSCSTNYRGFSNQVEWAAWQLRYNYGRSQGNGADFQVGQTMSGVDGKYNVTFGNAATASIYRYTPHVFDSAFNFYNLYNTWFVPHPDTTADDTTGFNLRTYGTSQKISGTKQTTSIAYFNGNQIAGLGSNSWSLDLSSLPVGTNRYTIDYKNSGGTLLSQKAITIEIHKPGDVNGDGNVEIQDLSIFADYYGQINPEEPLANLTGVVGHEIDVQDLSILAGYWQQ